MRLLYELHNIIHLLFSLIDHGRIVGPIPKAHTQQAQLAQRYRWTTHSMMFLHVFQYRDVLSPKPKPTAQSLDDLHPNYISRVTSGAGFLGLVFLLLSVAVEVQARRWRQKAMEKSGLVEVVRQLLETWTDRRKGSTRRPWSKVEQNHPRSFDVSFAQFAQRCPFCFGSLRGEGPVCSVH